MGEWYCFNCDLFLIPERVTFEKTCDTCGSGVKIIEREGGLMKIDEIFRLLQNPFAYNENTAVEILFPHHSKEMIYSKLKQMKQQDGEAWAIADFVERILQGR